MLQKTKFLHLQHLLVWSENTKHAVDETLNFMQNIIKLFVEYTHIKYVYTALEANVTGHEKSVTKGGMSLLI